MLSTAESKTDHREYRHKDFDPFHWSNYPAWLALKSHPKFIHPRPPPPDDDVEEINEDEEEEEEEATNLEEPTPTVDISESEKENSSGTPASSTSSGRVLTRKKNHSSSDEDSVADLVGRASRTRGAGGRGCTAAKEDIALKMHRSKKLKALDDLKKIQQQRLNMQQTFLNSQQKYQEVMMLQAALQHEQDTPKRTKLISRLTALAGVSDTTLSQDTSYYMAQTQQTQQQNPSQEDNLVDMGDGVFCPPELLRRTEN